MSKRVIEENIEVCEKKARVDVGAESLWTATPKAVKSLTVKKLFEALRDFQPELARECWASGVRIECKYRILQVCDTGCDCSSTFEERTLDAVILYLLGDAYSMDVTIDADDNLKAKYSTKRKPRVCPPEVAATFIRDILNTPGLKPLKTQVQETIVALEKDSLEVPEDVQKFKRNWVKSPYYDDVPVSTYEYWGEGELEAHYEQDKATCAAIVAVLCAEYQ